MQFGVEAGNEDVDRLPGQDLFQPGQDRRGTDRGIGQLVNDVYVNSLYDNALIASLSEALQRETLQIIV